MSTLTHKAATGRSIYRIKYIQHWWWAGGITNKVIDVIAESAWHAKDIVEIENGMGSVYGLLRNGNDIPL